MTQHSVLGLPSVASCSSICHNATPWFSREQRASRLTSRSASLCRTSPHTHTHQPWFAHVEPASRVVLRAPSIAALAAALHRTANFGPAILCPLRSRAALPDLSWDGQQFWLSVSVTMELRGVWDGGHFGRRMLAHTDTHMHACTHELSAAFGAETLAPVDLPRAPRVGLHVVCLC